MQRQRLGGLAGADAGHAEYHQTLLRFRRNSCCFLAGPLYTGYSSNGLRPARKRSYPNSSSCSYDSASYPTPSLDTQLNGAGGRSSRNLQGTPRATMDATCILIDRQSGRSVSR